MEEKQSSVSTDSTKRPFVLSRFEQKNTVPSIDLENWMGNLPHHLATVPVIYLSIPGSHNSFSYSISPGSDISPDSPSIVQQLGKYLKPLVKRIVYRWSVGQERNVTEQLTYGVRYFDIRLVIKNSDILIAHGLFGGNIDLFLKEINNFLVSHSKEIVILDFQHFYQFTCNEDHQKLILMLETIFKNKIYPRQRSMKSISLEKMWKGGHQILIIYRCTAGDSCSFLWHSNAWITPWPDKLKVDELLECLDRGMVMRKDDQGYVTQGVLTPTVQYIVFHLYGSLKRLALVNNPKIVSWLETKKNGKNGINVVICDFIQSYEFCEIVVRLNYKE